MQDTLGQILALYRNSFPKNERRSEPDLLNALATPAYRTVTKLDRHQLLGFAIMFVPRDSDFTLLEYLAVHENYRGIGIGRALVSSAIEEAHGRPLLTELESASNRTDAHRRQQFYTRLGFRPIKGLRYQLPLPDNPPPMELWMHQQSRAPIKRPRLADWLTKIYTQVYHCSADDPRIAEMLNDLPNRHH
jgi:GNAT superfamily N-acetyltransferase